MKADLSGANFKRADLSGANLKMADLNGIGLSRANLHEVRYDNLTRWSEGFDPTHIGAYYED